MMHGVAEHIWQAVAALQRPEMAGFTVEVLPQIDSTNTELMRRARMGTLEPTLLVALRQSAGRGRAGRVWHSDDVASVGALSAAGPSQDAKAPGNGIARAPSPAGGSAAHEVASVGALSALTFSLGLPLAPHDWQGLSLVVGISVAESLHRGVQIKWPNDLWWQGRKLAGILIETASMGAQRYAVIGVGINIGTRPADGLRTPPAWLQELWPDADAAQALQRVAAPLLQDVLTFAEHGFAPFAARFAARDALQGNAVELTDGPGTAQQGTAHGVDATGALLVHTSLGMQRITSAEVSVRPRIEPLPD